MKILFYPDGQHERWAKTKMAAYIDEIGAKRVTDPSKSFDHVIYWSHDHLSVKHDDIILELARYYDIINFGCNNVMKSKNEEIMMQAFGYNSLVNPYTSKQFLEKSEWQGKHEMHLKNRIRVKRPGYIYVKLIDSRINNDTVRDYRVIVFDRVVALQTRDKPIADRFRSCRKNRGGVTRWYYDINSFFSTSEIDNIEKYCNLYRSEITELDVLRDKDERLYIVDNNNISGYSDDMRAMYNADSKKILRYCCNKLIETLKKHGNSRNPGME